MKKWIGLGMLLLYVLTVVAANYAVERWGVVSVGFGLMAPAAVYFVGVAFTLRDIVHETLGRLAVAGGIVLGAGLSYFVSSGRLALASAIAFLISELADWSVYAPLRRRGWLKAVVASNIVGLIIDSIIFLWIAFGSMEFLRGQIVGKAWMTGLALIVLLAVRVGARRMRVVYA